MRREVSIGFSGGQVLSARMDEDALRALTGALGGQDWHEVTLEDGAVRLRLEAFHPLGTARMAADPAAGVVGPNGEAHDVPGLYIADASVLPTSLKVNPMLTIMACARRIAATLADRVA